MRWYKGVITVALITLLPLVVSAQDDPSVSEIIESGNGATTPEGVDFDTGDNVLGNPANGKKVFGGTIEQLTFLSGGNDPVTITVSIINTALSFLGFLSLLFILYAGYTWFKAGDNEEDITKAKDIIKGALIGLALTLSAYGIAQLFFNGTLQKTQTTSWLNLFVHPAYAEEEAMPSETLPFDPYEGTRSLYTLTPYDIGSINLLDLGRADPVTLLILTVNGFLTLLGFIFLIFLLYAGILWLKARGNEEDITRAKTILKRAVVGLVIILSAYGISFLTFKMLSIYTS